MRTTTGSTSRTHTLARWAIPAAVALGLTGVGTAQATQAPADHAAEFDPGSVCSGTATTATTGAGSSLRLSRLVITAHAASIHATR